MLDRLNKFLGIPPSLAQEQVVSQLSDQMWRTGKEVRRRVRDRNPSLKEGFFASKLQIVERTLERILQTLQDEGKMVCKYSDELSDDEVRTSDDELILRHRQMTTVLTLERLKVYRLIGT